MRRREIVCICTLLGLQFGQTKETTTLAFVRNCLHRRKRSSLSLATVSLPPPEPHLWQHSMKTTCCLSFPKLYIFLVRPKKCSEIIERQNVIFTTCYQFLVTKIHFDRQGSPPCGLWSDRRSQHCLSFYALADD